MIKIRQQIIPASKEYIKDIKEKFCDKCEKNLDEEIGSYEVLKVEMYLEEGSHYPEGRMTEKTHIDCCSGCFKEHVLPALLAVGFTPRVSDVW